MTNKQMATYVAEFVGTFVLATVVFVVGGSYGVLGALMVGLALAVIVSMFAGVSGAHVNPAVTAGMLAVRKIKLADALGYVVAQGLGAILAWQLVEYFSGAEIAATTADYSGKLLLSEALGAAIFGMAIAAVVRHKQQDWQGAVTIGLGFMVGLVIASLGAYDSGALIGTINPAVSLGLRSFSVETLVGPMLGAVVGMTLYMWLTDLHARKK